MKYVIFLSIFLLPNLQVAQESDEEMKKRVTSEIDSNDVMNTVLIQSFDVNAPVSNVWEAYTTKAGWESWAVVNAEIDFRLGGFIQTSYSKTIQPGDPGSITLNIINFVPYQMLTLQAEMPEHFPEFMKKDGKSMYNTILMEETGPSSTRITSYGIGYKNNDQYKSMMKFFIEGNTQSYVNLIKYLETGKPSLKF